MKDRAEVDRPQAGGYRENLLEERNTVVATALWAVLLTVKDRAEVDRPQAGGYKENLLDEQNALAVQFFA